MSKIHIHYYSISIPDEQNTLKGRRFVFLSDLHSKVYGENNQELISALKSCKPDYVLIGGDMFIGYREEKKEKKRKAWVAEQLATELAFHYPVYYTDGNHEGKCPEGWMEEYRMRLKQAGVIFLNNSSIEVEPHLWIHGLTLEQSWYPKGRRLRYPLEEMQSKLGKLDMDNRDGVPGRKDGIHVLMAHHPGYFETYSEWGADLVLSGHFHGGVMRLPYIGGLIGPDYLPFPPYSGGIYQKKDCKMLVSCGLGAHTIPVRIFNPPELLCVIFE